MKKLFFASALFLFLFFLITDNIHAQEWLPCPSEEMDCPEFHEYDCLYPCVGFATRVGCPESPGRCQCQIPIEAKTVPLGGRCQHAGNCAPPGKYCYGECNQAPICHETESGSSDLWCPGFENQKLNTAIGCIPILTTKEAFLSFVLKWAVGIGGGIAFLLIIYASFMIMTSAGNPERLKAGQELLTSAISGLILLIFSVVILKIIGVDILELDQWGFGK